MFSYLVIHYCEIRAYFVFEDVLAKSLVGVLSFFRAHQQIDAFHFGGSQELFDEHFSEKSRSSGYEEDFVSV